MKDQATWHKGDEAHIVIRKPNDCLHTVLRQVKLDDKLHEGVWRVQYDDIADDAEIESVDIAIEEHKLHKTAEEAIQEYVSEIVTDLLNENRDWYQEITECEGD